MIVLLKGFQHQDINVKNDNYIFVYTNKIAKRNLMKAYLKREVYKATDNNFFISNLYSNMYLLGV